MMQEWAAKGVSASAGIREQLQRGGCHIRKLQQACKHTSRREGPRLCFLVLKPTELLDTGTCGIAATGKKQKNPPQHRDWAF